MRTRLLAFILLASLVAACAPALHGAAPASPALRAGPIGGSACAGAIDAPPAGTRAVDDAALLQESLGETGKGKLCTGQVFEATQPLPVYRVWSAAREYTELGRWWSLGRPAGPLAAYREQNAICPEWSALDALSVCEVKVGARFVIGPGQSARCDGGAGYGKSPANQIYIPNDTRAQRVFVQNCRRLGAWP